MNKPPKRTECDRCGRDFRRVEKVETLNLCLDCKAFFEQSKENFKIIEKS